MPQTGPVVIRLDPELAARLTELEARLAPALEAAGDLAHAARTLLEIVPPHVSPVVLVRDRVAPLQAALDAFLDAAGTILEEQRPA